MPDLDIEDVIDKLLVFLVEDMEEQGVTSSSCFYHLGPEHGHRGAFVARYPGLELEVTKALNICLTRKYLKPRVIGSQYDCLSVTTLGQARALSVKLKKPNQPAQPTYNIGAITAHGPMQFGNGNTMTITAFQEAALAGIEAADAPPDQKAEAKGLLAKVLEHPLLCSVLGGIAGGVTSGMMGTGGTP